MILEMKCVRLILKEEEGGGKEGGEMRKVKKEGGQAGRMDGTEARRQAIWDTGQEGKEDR